MFEIVNGKCLSFVVCRLWLNEIANNHKPQTTNHKLLFFLLLLPLSIFSQTLSPPTITCVATDPNTGDVTINWIVPSLNPCGPFTAYVLYGATDTNGPYLAVDTITNQAQTTARHQGANGTILNWYYFMVTWQNCPGSVSLSSDTVGEETLDIPELDYVTVTQGGVIIKWIPIASSQTAGYIIYYATDSGYYWPIDTVFGRLSDTYVDLNLLPNLNGDPNQGSVSYTIEAFDDCHNPSGINDSAHQTIFLTASIEPCQQQVTLNWTPYYNWRAGVDSYLVETSIDNAPFSVAQSLNDGSYGPYNYSLAGLTADSICFRISAIRQNDAVSSASNVICFAHNQTRPTAFNYLRNVTVNSSGGVDIQWYADSSADINTYFVKRSSDGISFTTINTIPVANPVLLDSVTDATAPTSSSSFYYQVISIDDCNYSPPPTTGKTILLTGSSTGIVNALQWNAFELDNATVLSYTIYLIQNGTLVPDTTVSPAMRNFEDYIGTDISEDGSFCYVVEASFNLDIPGFINEPLKSTSNQLCLYQAPVIYVPKAFVPGGKNNYFKPTLLNSNVADYEFVIFDRWGKKLFETDQVNIGWDGSNNGERLPLGGYAYYIKVVSKGGVAQEKKGMVVLVR